MPSVKYLATFITPAQEDNTCAEIYDRFMAEPDLIAVPVVASDKPIGLLKRTEFLVKLADRFGRPLYEKRPVTVLMDAAPLLVDLTADVQDLYRQLATSNQAAVHEGFIIVDKEKYFGVGTAVTLLQANIRSTEERMKELQKAKLVAEAAARTKSQFLATMSHELRTPLNSIIGFSDLIIGDKLQVFQSNQVLNYVEDIRNSGQHLLQVINGILDMSKIESGNFELREDYEDPCVLAEQVVRMMSSVAAKKSIAVTIECTVKGMDVYADLQVLRQILLNLLSNAVKFSPHHSQVVLKIEETATGQLVFTVSDKGCGIPEESLQEVLKPFTQVDGVFARQHEGTGLGLSLVVAFVEAHSGMFELISKQGQGTDAIVTLPSERTISAAAPTLHSCGGMI
ncbi:hypothetical protein GCM10017044_19050 [Kordiimonas sediminis]|uniref:histidine kinase n=1 Tax=Kordiimonas sediminis TaxID=1735581 RepID=A0A919AUG1_9PROT|nr:ATP-binding protein [Kordiimonas sediminis]GHF24572.1 hypothetical protein GCM10017044_19050 [Kordiimonas sediminis]